MTTRLRPLFKDTQFRRSAEAGITLIEVLVVLAVIGVATGATMLGLNAVDRNTRAEAEAVRLARQLSISVDDALVGGAPLAMIWDAQGYQFVGWSAADARWAALSPGGLAARHDLRAPVVLTVLGTDGTDPVMIAPGGLSPAASFRFASNRAGSGASWIVDFDGFSAVARPEVTQ